ncbi:MAG: prolyl oligopeptidase family serine peptidase [Chloroflexi bacterium]|nr:prolyl oligopeptidase family serine peptidase [Chloroflexota bacterium]
MQLYPVGSTKRSELTAVSPSPSPPITHLPLFPTQHLPYNPIMKNESILTLDRLFDGDEFKANAFGPARWLDETGYTTLEPSPADIKVNELVRYDTTSGERVVLITAVQLTPPNTDTPLVIKNYEWSPNKTHLLIFTNSKRVWRQNTRGDYWVLTLNSGQLTQLGGDASTSTLMFAKFAPDNQSVAYVRANNIYVEEIATNNVTQLTTDGSDQLINGTSDWVNEEEFGLRDGFCWSPDSQKIAYWQFDTTGIDTFYMINNTDSLYPQLIPLPYPKVGTTNAACRVGVVNAAGGKTTWFDTPGDPRMHYIPKMEWAANANEVIIQQLNRLQNQNLLLLGNVKDGSTSEILTESDEAWVDVHNDLKWLDEGRAFTWISERDGWRQVYKGTRNGRSLTPLTPDPYDVISVQNIDEKTGWVYFIASPHNPTQRYLYRVPLDGSGKAERLTPADMPGTHSYQLSPHANYAFHTTSTIDKPPVVSLISLPDHQPLRILEANQSLHDKVTALAKQPTEFFRVKIEDVNQNEADNNDDDVLLDGWCIKPPDFDPTKTYPLLFHVYGEPASQTVLDRWGGKRHLWHLMLAQQGYVVISLDNRGTPAPRGRAWRKCIYRQIGVLATDEQAAAAEVIMQERPYIDKTRIGIWGWSGGGSMTLNLMFKYPQLYQTGIAVAAVSHQHFYDTIYQERYMGLPNENEQDFKNGSPITFAHQLTGNLMLIHGTGDDNVHYQCFEAMVNELIKHNKQFEMMAYPNRTHAIKEGKNTSRHLHSVMTHYLQKNL